MKSNIITLLSLALFICLVSSSSAQSDEIARKKIVPLKYGQGELINGMCKITLKDPRFENYYSVMITPLEEIKDWYISEKTKEYFIVRSNIKFSNVKFDYIASAEIELPRRNERQIGVQNRPAGVQRQTNVSPQIIEDIKK